ncbi:hypothetical protein Tco_0382019 [Tanacetum coccineum]
MKATNGDNVRRSRLLLPLMVTQRLYEASLRRHLKLDDHDGITSIPNSEIFEQLALMGYHTYSDKLTFAKRKQLPTTLRTYHVTPLIASKFLTNEEAYKGLSRCQELILFPTMLNVLNFHFTCEDFTSSTFTLHQNLLLNHSPEPSIREHSPDHTLAEQYIPISNNNQHHQPNHQPEVLILRVKKLETQVKGARVVLSEDDEDVEDEFINQRRRKYLMCRGSRKASTETEPIIQEVTPTETRAYDTEKVLVLLKRIRRHEQWMKNKGHILQRMTKLARHGMKEEGQRLCPEAKSSKKYIGMILHPKIIVPREEFAEDVESLSTKYLIVDWKTYVLTENFMYYQIFGGDGSSKNYKILSEMLEDFDRQDVMDLHSTNGVSTASTYLVLPKLVNTARRKINIADGQSC